MAVFHDEVEIEDFEFDEETSIYTYPCPCGDKFEITLAALKVCACVLRCFIPSFVRFSFIYLHFTQFGIYRLARIRQHVHRVR
jgi:hypothetical protein